MSAALQNVKTAAPLIFEAAKNVGVGSVFGMPTIDPEEHRVGVWARVFLGFDDPLCGVADAREIAKLMPGLRGRVVGALAQFPHRLSRSGDMTPSLAHFLSLIKDVIRRKNRVNPEQGSIWPQRLHDSMAVADQTFCPYNADMMTGSEFDQYLLRLGLTPAEAAQLLSVNARTVRRWLDGEEVSGPAEQAIRAWIRLHDRHLPWRPDSASIIDNDQDQIARHRSHAITLNDLLARVEARGGARLPWNVDWDRGHATLGPMEVSFYKLLNGGFSLGTYTRKDGYPDVERDIEIIEDAAYCIAQALKKKNPDFGPVTLFAFDGPSKGRVAVPQLQGFPTARDAIRHACEVIGSPGFHDPFITTESPTELLWDTRELRQECERRTKAPPALAALADYVQTNSGTFAISGAQMLEPAEAARRRQRIEMLGAELRALANRAHDGMADYPTFEAVLSALHAAGFFPKGELVSAAATRAGTRMIEISPQTIDALALVISGGGGNDTTPPIGLYRSGPRLESFMRSCGVMMSVGAASRVPALVSAIIRTVNEGNDQALKTIIERAADPRDFVQEPEKLEKVLRHLNSYLMHDGYELQCHGSNSRLMKRGTSAPAIAALAVTVATVDFDTVQRDLDRALARAENDPEDAVTAACSDVESVCRSVLGELGLPPSQLDIQGLYKAVREPLGLSPGKEDVATEIAADVRAILGGLNSAVQGIGSLRTHAGDAHGRGRGFRRLDSRIARLAIHAASGIALFIIETWQKKFPAKPLHAVQSR